MQVIAVKELHMHLGIHGPVTATRVAHHAESLEANSAMKSLLEIALTLLDRSASEAQRAPARRSYVAHWDAGSRNRRLDFWQ